MRANEARRRRDEVIERTCTSLPKRSEITATLIDPDRPEPTMRDARISCDAFVVIVPLSDGRDDDFGPSFIAHRTRNAVSIPSAFLICGTTISLGTREASWREVLFPESGPEANCR